LVTVKEQGAVHVHHALAVPLPDTAAGSPGSAVNPALDPVAVSAPDPVNRNRLAKLLLDGSNLYVNLFNNVLLWLSGFVTTMLTDPAACAPVVAVIVVAETRTTFVAATPPIDTVAPVVKPVPVIVTGVPPKVGPDPGAIEDTTGGGPSASYVKPPTSVLLSWFPEFVTTTSAAPAACAPVVAVTVVEFTCVTFVAATPPIVTVTVGAKFVPVIVTAVPPLVEPDVGEIDVTVGGVTNVKPLVSATTCASGFVTTTSAAPAACAGVDAVIVVELTTTTLPAAAPPTVTVAPGVKLVPVIVTAVAPSVDPDVGAIDPTVGAAPRGPPVPNRSTPDASGALISRTAVLAPFTVGSKVTWIVWLAPAARLSGQFDTANSPGSVPVRVHPPLENVIGEELVFVIVMP
jgi:hypothetical protein